LLKKLLFTAELLGNDLLRIYDAGVAGSTGSSINFLR
jgi:NCAIR mutase (PurE)-related protein